MRTAIQLLSTAALPALALAAFVGGEETIDQAELESITERIRGQIEELRGERFPRQVEVRVADRAAFLDYVNRRLEKTTTPEEVAAQETVAKLLGLIPAEMDYMATLLDMLEEQVGGFYDPEDESFYLMETFTGALAKIILAHELTHALDDQLYDIDGTLDGLAGNSDAQLAFHAVVEGSGTAVMNRWTIEHAASLDPGEMASAGSMGMEALEDLPPFLWKPLVATYLRGAAFLARSDSVIKGQMTMPTPDDVRRAFREPPRSSEQILHPEKYWDDEERDDPVPVSIRPPGQDWEVLHEDSLGEIGLALCVESPGKRGGVRGQLALLGTRYTGRATEGWGGDRLVLLGRGAERLLLVVTVWDTTKDADQFEQALDDVREHVAAGASDLGGVLELGGGGASVLRRGDVVCLASWAGPSREEAEGILAELVFEAVAPAPAPR